MDAPKPSIRLPPLIGDLRPKYLAMYHMPPSDLEKEKSSHRVTSMSLKQSRARVAQLDARVKWLETQVKWLETQYVTREQENRRLRLSLGHLVSLSSNRKEKPC